MTNRCASIFIAAVTLVVGAFGTRLRAESPTGATSFLSKPDAEVIRKNEAWMSRVPDDISLAEISIPGTHDTCALHNGYSFGFAKCQAWSLEDQLAVGIRFLDIRCRHVGDTFQIYHGAIDQQISFASVRDACREFLIQFPTECIVMSVKEESTPMNVTQSFIETFRHEIEGDGNLWLLQNQLPLLGQSRGRIVVLDRVGSLGGYPWQKLRLQDDYQAALSKKETLIRKHLELASSSEGNSWFVNFCSGTLPTNLVTPRQYSVRSNEVAFQFLREHQDFPARIGTVVMDFPGERLITRIIESNFEAKLNHSSNETLRIKAETTSGKSCSDRREGGGRVHEKTESPWDDDSVAAES
jgi:1-phosphatidylinositol phosphodiesterase